MTKITVNGTSVEVPDGANVSVINGQVIINDNKIGSFSTDLKIEVIGGLINLKTDRSVTVNGSVTGNVDSAGSIEVKGNVGGKACANGNIQCGEVHGDVDAGGNVMCGSVKGDVDAGGNVIGGR